MSRLILYMSMSLDGFISGPGDDMDNPLGAGGERLHEWLRDDGPEVAAHRPSAGPSQIVFDELMATGAVITGPRTGDFVDYWGGDHHDGVRSSCRLTARRPRTVTSRSTSSPIASSRVWRRSRLPLAIATCCCTAPTPPRSASAPVCWTYSRSSSSPSYLARVDFPSTASSPSTSSSNWSGRWRYQTCFICATRCDAHDRIDDRIDDRADPALHVDVRGRLHRRTRGPGRAGARAQRRAAVRLAR